jgi:hypothetical protein
MNQSSDAFWLQKCNLSSFHVICIRAMSRHILGGIWMDPETSTRSRCWSGETAKACKRMKFTFCHCDSASKCVLAGETATFSPFDAIYIRANPRHALGRVSVHPSTFRELDRGVARRERVANEQKLCSSIAGQRRARESIISRPSTVRRRADTRPLLTRVSID